MSFCRTFLGMRRTIVSVRRTHPNQRNEYLHAWNDARRRTPIACRARKCGSRDFHCSGFDRNDYDAIGSVATRAAIVPTVMLVPPAGPAPAEPPQPPHQADGGTMTGFILETTATETSVDLSIKMETKLARLSNNNKKVKIHFNAVSNCQQPGRIV